MPSMVKPSTFFHFALYLRIARYLGVKDKTKSNWYWHLGKIQIIIALYFYTDSATIQI